MFIFRSCLSAVGLGLVTCISICGCVRLGSFVVPCCIRCFFLVFLFLLVTSLDFFMYFCLRFFSCLRVNKGGGGGIGVAFARWKAV